MSKSLEARGLLPWLAGPMIAAAACGGGGSTDIQSTLVFADRSDAEITRLINAAAGTDIFSAEAQINRFGDTFDADPCPTITVAGDTVTVTGGCTTADGTQIQGSAVVTNPFAFDQVEYRYGSDTLYEANQLVIGDANFSQSFDGFLRRTDDFSTWDADLTVDSFGVVVRSDLYYHCTNPSSPSCSLSGSGIELVGVGGARVSGHVSIDLQTNQQSSSFTLKGVDTLTVDVSNNCLTWQIEGTERGSSTCPQARR